MSALKKVKQIIKKEAKRHEEVIFNYVIPEVWDGYQLTPKESKIGQGLLRINPFEFTNAVIEQILTNKTDPAINELKPYYLTHPVPYQLKNGDWIKQSIVYSMMLRTSSSFDHDRNFQLDASNLYALKDTGTFVKTLWILPFLKKMGVDVLYLLPISKYSLKDKKGEAGSPYGVSNFFKLDENLKDPLTGEQGNVELEFQALVEAAHILGMKVVIDIIPRTNSVNSDLILTNPEWFYWVKKQDLATYKPPFVPTLNEPKVADPKYFKEMFASEEVIRHILSFVENPKQSNPMQWEMMLEYYAKNPMIEPLDLIAKFFDVSVAYAFSDNINDPQPAWSDVTYFRMYLDHPSTSQPYLDALGINPAPYLLYDVAKASLNPGKIPNKALWNTLSDILPYYQKKFGIDGARIDMGHALPSELINQILTKAKKVNPEFCFIAEELDVKNAKASVEKGYNMIIGDGFMRQPGLDSYKYNEFFYTVKSLECPVFACGETHDTPRLAARDGGKETARMIALMNFFIPNAIPFINSGQEFYEIQPMNLGIGAREGEQFLLTQDDPYYGKLALFDFVSFHMTEKDRYQLSNDIQQILPIREKYLPSILNLDNSTLLGFDHERIRAVAVGYESENSYLIALAHTNFYHDDVIRLHCHLLPEKFKYNVTIKEVFTTDPHNHATFYFNECHQLNIFMKKSEVKLIEIKFA